MDNGRVTDPRLDPADGVLYTNTVGTYNYAGRYFPRTPPYLFRTMYLGARNPDSLGTANRDQFNLAPHGLGFLLHNGYLGDARSYFCPSSEGMPNRSIDWLGYWAQYGYEYEVADGLEDLRKAGGFTARDVSHGDWSWLDSWTGYGYRLSYTRVMMSHYFYRCMPSGTMGGTGSHWGWPDGDPVTHGEGSGMGQYHRILGIRPDRKVFPGEPVFKTQKQLGARALVTDAWGRSAWNQESYAVPGGESVNPGEGFHGHRDGYNVLYGDWSAKWFGDPNQRLIWWEAHSLPMAAELTSGRADYDVRYNICANHMLDAAVNFRGANKIFKAGNSGEIWHNFDVAAGVDVAVDEDFVAWDGW